MILKRAIPVLIALYAGVAEAALCVKTLIFDNVNNSVMIEFSEPIIVENVFLMKKIDKDDICVPIASLNDDILFPSDYFQHVEKFKKIDPESKKYLPAKRRVETSRMEVLLSQEVFDQKEAYLFKVITFEEENEIYTEEFVYSDNSGFEHKSSSDKSRWYASSWPWIAIGFIIITALLLLKIICC